MKQSLVGDTMTKANHVIPIRPREESSGEGTEVQRAEKSLPDNIGGTAVTNNELEESFDERALVISEPCSEPLHAKSPLHENPYNRSFFPSLRDDMEISFDERALVISEPCSEPLHAKSPLHENPYNRSFFPSLCDDMEISFDEKIDQSPIIHDIVLKPTEESSDVAVTIDLAPGMITDRASRGICGMDLWHSNEEYPSLHGNTLDVTAVKDHYNDVVEGSSIAFSILKVPEYYRQPPEEFTPVGWRFGLHSHKNRDTSGSDAVNLDTSGSDAIKLSVAKALGLVGPKWGDFCNAVVDPKTMLQIYGLEEEGTSLSKEREGKIKHVLALDALFLALFYDLKFPKEEKKLLTAKVASLLSTSSLYRRWRNIIAYDICKIENQIPFDLIKGAVDYLKKLPSQFGDKDSTTDGNDGQKNCGYLQKWMEYAVKDGLGDLMDISADFLKYKNSSDLTKSKHVLEAAYEVICGHEGGFNNNLRHGPEGYIHIPSASKLKASGIEIKGLEGPLCTMSYKEKELSLPKMNMNDNTVALIRNMARYEEYHTSEGCMFHDYVFLMVDLIQTPEDLEILIECGVIHNGIGITAFQKWNALEQGLLLVRSSFEHNNMKEQISKRCAFKRYRFWNEFKIEFCSRPWLVLSTFTIVLITLATLLQTYVSIISSNRMKPEFP